MSEIADLLEKLKQLDPATYQEITHFESSGYHEPRNQALAWLQFCIQQAISSKGWRYIQSTHYDALDRIFYAAEVRDHENFDLSKGGSYESMASAMLSAYISCLESQP